MSGQKEDFEFRLCSKKVLEKPSEVMGGWG